ncbi:MAG: hypothetical protein AAGF58_10625, partial [Pseudomonadota bacterium]
MDLKSLWQRADRKWVRETALAFFGAAWALATMMHVAAIAQSARGQIFAILPWAMWNGLKYALPVSI